VQLANSASIVNHPRSYRSQKVPKQWRSEKMTKDKKEEKIIEKRCNRDEKLYWF
jgi:hypothetical protein